AEVDTSAIPDPHAPSEFGVVRQIDIGNEANGSEHCLVSYRHGRAYDLRMTHAPVAEAVNGHRPETEIERVSFVGAEVLGEKGEKSDVARILVRFAGGKRTRVLGDFRRRAAEDSPAARGCDAQFRPPGCV